jgi:adenylate kinase
MNPQTYIFISRSGGGKGTQIDLLEEYFKEKELGEMFILEAGQRFREFIASNSHTAKLAQKLNDEGSLQPAFLSIWAWSGYLVRNLDDHHHLFVDGTPRRLGEAKILDEAFAFYGRDNIKVIYINVSKEESKKRMLARKRRDDNVQSIEKRSNWFDNDVLPVIDFFKSNDRYEVFDIRGEQAPGAVRDEILLRLGI